MSEVGEDLIARTLRTVGLSEAILPEPNEHRRVAVEGRIDLGLAETHIAGLGPLFNCAFYFLPVGLGIHRLRRDSEHRYDLVYRRTFGDLRCNPLLSLLRQDICIPANASRWLGLEDADVVLAVLVLHHDVDSAILSDCGHQSTS